MKKILSILLVLIYHTSLAQVPWAIFHGCEKHCGIYPNTEYQNFKDIKWQFKTDGKIFSSPAILNGVAYVGSEDKNLYAIDINNGNLIWKFETGGAVHSSPAVFQGVVYFGSFDGYYYAVDANTGAEKWRFKTGGEKWIGANGYFGMKPADQFLTDPWQFFLSSPIIDPKAESLVVYFGSSDGNLYAVDAADGKLRWSFKTNGAIHSSPALYEGKLFVGSWDANLYAIDANTGKEIWKFQTGTQSGMTGIQASPTIDDNKVYIGARDANLYALDINTGKMVWKHFFDNSWILSTAAVKDGVVYVGTSDTFELVALNGKSGERMFSIKGNGYVYSSPAVLGSTAFFGDFTGKLFSIDLEKRRVADFHEMKGRKKNRKLLIQDNMNYMALATGKDMSQYKTHTDVMDQLYSLGSIVSSPAVGDGVVYFGSSDGNLYALNLENERIKKEEASHKHHQ